MRWCPNNVRYAPPCLNSKKERSPTSFKSIMITTAKSVSKKDFSKNSKISGTFSNATSTTSNTSLLSIPNNIAKPPSDKIPAISKILLNSNSSSRRHSFWKSSYLKPNNNRLLSNKKSSISRQKSKDFGTASTVFKKDQPNWRKNVFLPSYNCEVSSPRPNRYVQTACTIRYLK